MKSRKSGQFLVSTPESYIAIATALPQVGRGRGSINVEWNAKKWSLALSASISQGLRCLLNASYSTRVNSPEQSIEIGSQSISNPVTPPGPWPATAY